MLPKSVPFICTPAILAYNWGDNYYSWPCTKLIKLPKLSPLLEVLGILESEKEFMETFERCNLKTQGALPAPASKGLPYDGEN